MIDGEVGSQHLRHLEIVIQNCDVRRRDVAFRGGLIVRIGRGLNALNFITK